MAATPRPRSTFWIVSTHVLTTGFAMPILATIAAFAALQAIGPLDFYLELAITLALQALGYIGGVYYSLSYLKKVAIARNPIACIIPSNITFTALAALGLGWSIHSLHLLDFPLVLAIVAIFYAGITVVFALVTRQGFRRMAGDTGPRGFEVRPIPVMPPSSDISL